MCAILELYQAPEGVHVPEPLRKYLPGAPDFIPYTKELPKDSTSQKARGKTEKGAKQKAPAAADATTAAVQQAAEKLDEVKV